MEKYIKVTIELIENKLVEERATRLGGINLVNKEEKTKVIEHTFLVSNGISKISLDMDTY